MLLLLPSIVTAMMNLGSRKILVLVGIICLAFTACSDDDSGATYEADRVGGMAMADLINPDGATVGAASFHQGPTGVLVTLSVEGLTPGAHGIHLHAVGACSPDFTAAGGHLTATDNAVHGLKNPERTVDNHDNGDLPNLYAAADGIAQAEYFTSLVTIFGGSMPSLLDADGATLVIHENPDDHVTQPIGGAGGRVACGIIR